MHMIFHATDNHRGYPVLARDPAQKRPKPLLEGWRHEFAPFFGAKDAMKIGTDVGHATIQSSLRDLGNSGLGPGTEVPGYFRFIPNGMNYRSA